MFRIPLPRGFGLLIIVLPTYRAPRKAKRPPLALSMVKGDLLAESRQLYAAGHQSAAAMVARVELERLLTILALENPEYGRQWLGFDQTAAWLRKANVIGPRASHATIVAADIGNRAAHGKLVARRELGAMFNAIDSLRRAVEKSRSRCTTAPEFQTSSPGDAGGPNPNPTGAFDEPVSRFSWRRPATVGRVAQHDA